MVSQLYNSPKKNEHQRAVDRPFLIAVTNALTRHHEQAFAHAFDEGVKVGVDTQKHITTRADERIKSELDTLTETVRQFEVASGIKINNWDAGRLGNAVRAITGDRLNLTYTRLADTLRQIEKTADQLRAELDEIELLRVKYGGEKP